LGDGRRRVDGHAQLVLIVDQFSPFVVDRVNPTGILVDVHERRVAVALRTFLGFALAELLDCFTGHAAISV